jgi:PhnB protein
MIKLNPYLNFAGQAEAAFTLYKTAFGGAFSSIVRFKDMPMEGVKIPKEDEDKIMHMALPVGNDILMGSDAPESMGFKVVPCNAAYIMIGVDSKAEADRIFAALSAGGSVEMPLADQPWGDYYGSLKDKFGILWMISYTYPKKA